MHTFYPNQYLKPNHNLPKTSLQAFLSLEWLALFIPRSCKMRFKALMINICPLVAVFCMTSASAGALLLPALKYSVKRVIHMVATLN